MLHRRAVGRSSARSCSGTITRVLAGGSPFGSKPFGGRLVHAGASTACVSLHASDGRRAVVMMSMNTLPVPSLCGDARLLVAVQAYGNVSAVLQSLSTDFGCALALHDHDAVGAVGARRRGSPAS